MDGLGHLAVLGQRVTAQDTLGVFQI